MNLVRTLIHGYLYFPYFYHKLTGTGPFASEGAVYVSSPVSPGDTPLKKALIRHYVRQFHESSCSVASVVSVVNALRSGVSDWPRPISQMDILDRVRVGHWKERMCENGYNGRRGVPLPLLGEMVKASLLAYDLKHADVETVHAGGNSGQIEKKKAALRRRLIEFESEANGLIIAHFNQGIYIPALGIPHISPVGGFDPRTDQVTLLDVDAGEQGGAYQIGFDTFYEGLACTYNPFFRHLGYKNGGYVYVKLG